MTDEVIDLVNETTPSATLVGHAEGSNNGPSASQPPPVRITEVVDLLSPRKSTKRIQKV